MVLCLEIEEFRERDASVGDLADNMGLGFDFGFRVDFKVVVEALAIGVAGGVGSSGIPESEKA